MSRQEEKSMRRENLELMLLKKKQSTSKALQCVETLIESNVSESAFRQTFPYINQSTYQDVIDERSITYICGYPLCSSPLKNIPKKQYSIVRCNGQLTLFDTVERKKFCSNICYKASKFIHDQLPSSPLWLIETKESDKFTLIPLDHTCRGSYGEEVTLNTLETTNVKNDETVINESQNVETPVNIDESRKNAEIVSSKLDNQSEATDEDEFFDSCSSLAEDFTESLKIDCNSKELSNSVEQKELVTKIEFSVQNKNVLEGKTIVVNNCEEIIEGDSRIESEIVEQESKSKTVVDRRSNLNQGIISNIANTVETNKSVEVDANCRSNSSVQNEPITSKVESKKRKMKSKRKELDNKKYKECSDVSPVLSAVLNTECKIREWVSIDTLNYLFGREKLRNILEEHGLLDKLQEKNIDSVRDPYLFERYMEICTRLNILDLKDSKFDKAVKDENIVPTKPLPDFKKLQEEAKVMELKVRSFYAGDRRVHFSEEVETSDNVDKFEGETKTNEAKQNVLPLVDQHAQHAFRRRIVLDHLNKVLPDVLRAVGITNLIPKKDVKDLVSTFTLSPKNVVFKPIEWHFIAIIIVKLFSVRDVELAKILAGEKARKYFTLMLMSYEQDSEYLDRLMTWLLYEHPLFEA